MGALLGCSRLASLDTLTIQKTDEEQSDVHSNWARSVLSDLHAPCYYHASTLTHQFASNAKPSYEPEGRFLPKIIALRSSILLLDHTPVVVNGQS